MNSEIESFTIGQMYSNDEIFRALKVSNAGGVRARLDDLSKVKRMVIMTSVAPSRLLRENPYHDRIEGNILVYTGAGREGDQELTGLNSRLIRQIDERFPIYLFTIIANRRDKKVGPKRWRFLGMLEYLRHYREAQVDVRGTTRLVWIFEFLIHHTPPTVALAIDEAISREICGNAGPNDLLSLDDRQVAGFPSIGEEKPSTAAILECAAARTRLLSLNPQEFEHVIKDVLLLTGFERVTVTRYSQDGGYDVSAYAGSHLWPLSDLLVQVQAKRWLHTVGRREVAEFRGSLEPFARGVVVTTSHFSKAALIEVNAPGRIPIGLIDGNQFGAIVNSLGPSFLESRLPVVASSD